MCLWGVTVCLFPYTQDVCLPYVHDGHGNHGRHVGHGGNGGHGRHSGHGGTDDFFTETFFGLEFWV